MNHHFMEKTGVVVDPQCVYLVQHEHVNIYQFVWEFCRRDCPIIDFTPTFYLHCFFLYLLWFCYSPVPKFIHLNILYVNFRSLPDLTLLKETSLRGFTFPSSNSEISLSSSSEGELLVVIKLIMIRDLQHISMNNIRNCLWTQSLLSSFLQVNADQEIFFVSSLSRKDIYRCVCVFVYLCKCI